MSPDRYDGHDSPRGQANRSLEQGTSARSVAQGNRDVAPTRHSYGNAGVPTAAPRQALPVLTRFRRENSGKASVRGNRGTKYGWRKESFDSRMYHHEKGSCLDGRSSGFPHRKPWRFGRGTPPWSWPRAPSRPSPWPRPCLRSPPAPSSLRRGRSAGNPCPADSRPDNCTAGAPFPASPLTPRAAPLAGSSASLNGGEADQREIGAR